MGIASKFNKNVINWGIETKNLSFVKANTLDKTVEYPFLGCWVSSDNGYGEGGVIITRIGKEHKLVNTPQSFVESIRGIRADQESIDQILAGKLNFRVEEYTSTKFKRKGCVIRLIDVE